MNKIVENKIAGIIYKHGEDDFSFWISALSAEENEEINNFLSKFANSGESLRGTKQDVVEEVVE